MTPVAPSFPPPPLLLPPLLLPPLLLPPLLPDVLSAPPSTPRARGLALASSLALTRGVQKGVRGLCVKGGLREGYKEGYRRCARRGAGGVQGGVPHVRHHRALTDRGAPHSSRVQSPALCRLSWRAEQVCRRPVARGAGALSKLRGCLLA